MTEMGRTRYLLGFDPGRDKCGLALARGQEVVCYEVVAGDRAIARVQEWHAVYPFEQVIVGNQTTSRQWQRQLQEVLAVEVIAVDERNSTLEARDRYWQFFPPQGWQRLIPKGLRLPPRPIDDIVAIVLLERYCGYPLLLGKRQ
ncbi:pre-16S rRNA-processing nuclease YqgF [uncultured Thermosynechococcus sp.]|uniref:pre-16S rRNA-processing nuclease YqgF n=1 Tax=uncultured Thermosynechococcus sp. TaxID=436945 RepID=UPI002612450E|nr:pre-16S rRNA-processing nuclease YqgF [uncultured Thermosynechococcus sp.]